MVDFDESRLDSTQKKLANGLRNWCEQIAEQKGIEEAHAARTVARDAGIEPARVRAAVRSPVRVMEKAACRAARWRTRR